MFADVATTVELSHGFAVKCCGWPVDLVFVWVQKMAVRRSRTAKSGRKRPKGRLKRADSEYRSSPEALSLRYGQVAQAAC